MPISKSAKKSLRKSIKNHQDNLFLKSKLKAILKKYFEKPDSKGFNEAQSVLDKARKKGILHKNKVSRVKTQMSKKLAVSPAKRTAKEKMSA